MTRIQILPRDIQPGDRIDRLVPETMGMTTVAIASVEKVRRSERTTYRIHPEEGKPFVVAANRPLLVERPS